MTKAFRTTSLYALSNTRRSVTIPRIGKERDHVLAEERKPPKGGANIIHPCNLQIRIKTLVMME